MGVRELEHSAGRSQAIEEGRFHLPVAHEPQGIGPQGVHGHEQEIGAPRGSCQGPPGTVSSALGLASTEKEEEAKPASKR